MLPELKATLQQLLKLPREEVDEQIADAETAEEVKGRIRQLLARASYKCVKGRVLARSEGAGSRVSLGDFGVLKDDLNLCLLLPKGMASFTVVMSGQCIFHNCLSTLKCFKTTQELSL